MADAPPPGPVDRKPDVGIGTLIAGDGVRGIGALFVFTTHVCLLADTVPDNNLLSYGWAAPILGHIDLALSAFFVLSGYLIARPYARAYVAGTRRPRLRNYVRNRVLRVVPVFYLLTALVLLRVGLDGQIGDAPGAERSNAWQVIGQFLFIQGQTQGNASIPIGPAWSIGAEVGFYIVIPLAAYGAYLAASRLRGTYERAGLASGLLFAGLVVLQIGTGRAPRVFANKAMLWLGARSYSFYLVHIWVLLELDHLLGRNDSIETRVAIMGLIGFPLTVLSGALSYRFVERPFLERKQRTTQHAPPEPAAPALEPAR